MTETLAPMNTKQGALERAALHHMRHTGNYEQAMNLAVMAGHDFYWPLHTAWAQDVERIRQRKARSEFPVEALEAE